MEKWLLFALALLLGVLGRWLPHPPNFTPVIAIAIYMSLKFDNKWLIPVLPVLIMILSDLLLGFHDTAPIVYVSLAVLALGVSLAHKGNMLHTRPLKVIGFSLAGSLWFFITTNAGVWWLSNLYPPTLQGLWQSYLAAVPFFHNTLFSTLIFMSVFMLAEDIIVRIKVTSKAKGPLI